MQEPLFGDMNFGTKTNRKKKKNKVSHIVKPENMTLEEWQIIAGK